MSRRDRVRLPAFQVFINALPLIDAYRRWYFSNYGAAEKNAAFKERACRAFAGSARYFSDDEIRDGLRRWHADFGDSCPPDDVKAFVRFITPEMSETGRLALAQARAALGHVDA